MTTARPRSRDSEVAFRQVGPAVFPRDNGATAGIVSFQLKLDQPVPEHLQGQAAGDFAGCGHIIAAMHGQARELASVEDQWTLPPSPTLKLSRGPVFDAERDILPKTRGAMLIAVEGLRAMAYPRNRPDRFIYLTMGKIYLVGAGTEVAIPSSPPGERCQVLLLA